MKKYIDYLFWKRSWFRMFFILLPTIAVMITILFISIFGHYSQAGNIGISLYVILFTLGIVDNNNMDKPENPFKKNNNEK